MDSVFLHDLSYALGEVEETLAQAEEKNRIATAAAHFADAGFFTHWMAAENTEAYDLALRATEPLRGEVEGCTSLIYSTCLTCNGNRGRWEEFTSSRDVKYLLDYPASHLQADLKLHSASVIGLNQQACTSVIGSIRVGRSLLLSEKSQEKILCVSADRFPEGSLYEQSYNLISDGACAFIMSRKPKGYRVLGTSAITNGAMARASDDEAVGSYFTYTHQVIQSALKDAGLTMADLAWVVPQNTNVKAWQILARFMGFPMDRVFCETLSKVGHIISSDNIVNLKTLEASGQIKSGDRLLLCMAGYGLNWQAAILEKV